MMLTRMVLTIALMAVGFTAAADDKTMDADVRVGKVLFDAANTGSDLYNAGNHEGCFRYYQGTLSAVLPMIEHRPALAGRVKAKLGEARSSRSPASGAIVESR